MKGLISPEECRYLEGIGKGRVVEIGSLGGLSTSCLVKGSEEVHCFDTFELKEPNRAYSKALDLPPDFTGSFRSVFERNIKDFREKIVIHEGDALKGDWSLPIDVLFIDCSIGEDFHKELVKKFYPYLKKDGLLIHQDFFYCRSPCLAPLMSCLSSSFEVVGNVDTSMVYRKTGEIREVRIDIGTDLPREIERFGGVKSVAGGILTTAYVYWLRQKGEKVDQVALSLMGNPSKRVWENLREAFQ